MTLALRSLADALLALLFPDRCAGCQQVGALLCPECQAALRPYALPLPALPSLDAAEVAFVFAGPLRDAVHVLKYRRIQRMAAPLGTLMAAHLRDHPLPADALIPVPLHPRRMAERGFNQSEALARQISRLCGAPLAAGLVRTRDTEHQARLDARARQQNVRESFAWHYPAPPPPCVLLIDDVLTTGATLGACAQALRSAGAREVYALALARSQPERAPRA